MHINDLNEIIQYLPIIIPIIIVQYTLAIVALIHILRHPHYRVGNRVMWIIIVLAIQLIGPILYFVIGRGEEE